MTTNTGMTHTEEGHLFLTNRPAWVKLVAPTWVGSLRTMDPVERNTRWAAAGFDLKLAILRLAEDELANALWKSTSLADMADVLSAADPETKRALWNRIDEFMRGQLRRFAQERAAA